MNQIVAQELGAWNPRPDEQRSRALAAELEAGKVLYFPHLDFSLLPEEKRFLDPRWSDGRAKNISFDPAQDTLKGATGNRADLDDLKTMVARFHAQALALVHALLPGYTDHLRIAPASFRPMPVAGRSSSWRKDDSRLHIDAFPSRPNRGERILRVFSNVNPRGEPRVWRVGEPFTDLAARMMPRLPKPLPGAAAVLAALHVTKSKRSDYDHYMLALHDRMKSDAAYQKTAPQQTMPFPPGCSWICFSDQTSHAVMSGQFMFEQTLHLPMAAQYEPDASPLRVLERIAGRALA
jgi:hypothetical protein